MMQLAGGTIRIPKYRKLNDVMDLFAFIEGQGYPIVIKPVDSTGSVDVRILRDEQQLNEVLKGGIICNERNMQNLRLTYGCKRRVRIYWCCSYESSVASRGCVRTDLYHSGVCGRCVCVCTEGTVIPSL
jgi:hypothetical protein